MSLALADLAGATDTEGVIATVDLVPAGEQQAAQGSQSLSAVVVNDGDGWSALCEEIEVAADGDSAQEAFDNLRMAVVAVLEVDSIESRPHTPANDVLALIDSHRGTEPIRVFIFQAPRS